MAVRQICEIGYRMITYVTNHIDYKNLPEPQATTYGGMSVKALKRMDGVNMRNALTRSDEINKVNLEKPIINPVAALIGAIRLGAHTEAMAVMNHGDWNYTGPPPALDPEEAASNDDIHRVCEATLRRHLGEETEEDDGLIVREAKRRRYVPAPPPLPVPEVEKETEPQEGTQEYLDKHYQSDDHSSDPSFAMDFRDDYAVPPKSITTRGETTRGAAGGGAGGAAHGAAHGDGAARGGARGSASSSDRGGARGAARGGARGAARGGTRTRGRGSADAEGMDTDVV